jgi:hypothetical protein
MNSRRWQKARLSAAAGLALLLPLHAKGETITEFLKAFHANPLKIMERLPAVVDQNGNAHSQGFLTPEIERRHSLALAAARESFLSKGFPAAKPGDKDDFIKLLDPGTFVERNIGGMQSSGLTSLVAPIKPWSDSYWPTYRGQIAYRYASTERGASKVWAENYAFAQENPASEIIRGGDGARISLLSPAEKYDYIVGDQDFTLTNYAWNRGKLAGDDGINVPTWMGICHGWSAAASMGTPFIGRNVTVISTDGIPVTFFPQDIKALQSMRWANGAPEARFVGGRCRAAHPKRNENGRVLDPDCFDVNPASWHLAVVNQLGKNHRGFVFDGDPGAEVWNFPLYSTRYRYFHPQTLEETDSWQNAQVSLDRYTIDKFKEFRFKDTQSVVGIYMDVTYPVEIEPGPSRIFDAPKKTVRYIYDLELDAGNNVIGGEWYSNAHPDFLWTFDINAQAMAFDENVIIADPWSNNAPVPAYARRASARGSPLYAFLSKLIEAAGPVQQP